ncbi:sugar transferase [Campylobacter hyointestinalis]|uniref:sugar transferase n=1 Tax=Campylobacter hyointestinalis TaxID=198 RepID=UPI000729CA6F|nr:sugar transferase [Campylobacter hyointestinalis]TWO19362.1 sugar transferase [Campylobacter hyointestinalis]CUU68195.1 exodeoxyribonuclease 7 large subunit [Campylobacter hyointestinalis subsp. hyointestinalis]
MIILGRKYKFTDEELRKLGKKFKTINIVRYRNRSEDEVLGELQSIAGEEYFDTLVLNTTATVGSNIIKYLTTLQFQKRKKPLKIITIEDFMEKYLNKCYIPGDNSDLAFLSKIKPFSPWQLLQKKIVDIIGTGILLLTMWPLVFIVKSKIKAQSPGSLYFKQDRVGKNGDIFKCIKFRTMHENSYHDPYTKKEDDRIYPFGKFMRKTRIDELPQILNVLRGEMHLIGPRAEWDILVKGYEQEIPYYCERHIIKPGITGWAQVMYPYGANTDDAKQKLMYDLYYIKHWSLWLELKVIYKTIVVVLGKKGI